MDRLPGEWPEPVYRVQSVSETGLPEIPSRYIKPHSQRPTSLELVVPAEPAAVSRIPLIDLGSFHDEARRPAMLREMAEACREWGIFQICNHGVDHEVMDRMKAVWHGFFVLPAEEKETYANDPKTYEGYGSRVGVERGAVMDWGDYFFLQLFPHSLRDKRKWPSRPKNCRQTVEEFADQMSTLYVRLMKALSMGLGLGEDRLLDAAGGEVAACLRVNYYPKCPQPELTLGLSPHSDPGTITIVLADDHVNTLQVRNRSKWVAIHPHPHSLIVNIADQIQVISNGIFKSVEHRVITNSLKERLSIVFFCNPKNDFPVGPAAEVVTEDRPARYKSMTFNEYRLFIRTVGTSGKRQVDSLTSK